MSISLFPGWHQGGLPLHMTKRCSLAKAIHPKICIRSVTLDTDTPGPFLSHHYYDYVWRIPPQCCFVQFESWLSHFAPSPICPTDGQQQARFVGVRHLKASFYSPTTSRGLASRQVVTNPSRASDRHLQNSFLFRCSYSERLLTCLGSDVLYNFKKIPEARLGDFSCFGVASCAVRE